MPSLRARVIGNLLVLVTSMVGYVLIGRSSYYLGLMLRDSSAATEHMVLREAALALVGVGCLVLALKAPPFRPVPVWTRELWRRHVLTELPTTPISIIKVQRHLRLAELRFALGRLAMPWRWFAAAQTINSPPL